MVTRRCGCAVFKTTLYIILAWFTLVALYFLLPFPLPSDINRDGLIRLNDGESITRVYRIQNFFPVREPFHGRTHVVLTFRWSQDSSTISLSPTSSLPAIDKANVTVHDAPVGDTDGVSPPYFSEADAVILSWMTRDLGLQGHREYGQLALTTQVVGASQQNWTTISILAADYDTLIPFHTPPLITISCETGDHHLVSVLFPSAPGSCLAPSSTIKLRMLLITLIAPVAVIGNWFITIVALFLKVFFGLTGAFVLGWLAREIYERYRRGILFPLSQRNEIGSASADDLVLLGQKQGTLQRAAVTKVEVPQ